jgi:hypothetical protein
VFRRNFRGFFSWTPNNACGWILTFFHETAAETKRTPDYQNYDFTGQVFSEYEIDRDYYETIFDYLSWHLVGPYERLPGKVVGRVVPDTTHPDGDIGDQWIEVNLAVQTIAVHDQRNLVFATVIASGLDTFLSQLRLFYTYKEQK